jgi:hypothetical protein
MKRALWLLVAMVMMFSVSSLWAQAAYNPVAEVHFNKPKPGTQYQYEEGRKRHMSWHRSQTDKWTWVTWQILTGPNTGSFVIASPGHHWTDFDGREQFQEADSTDANRNMAGLLDEQSMSYWIQRVDLSHNPNWDKPAKLITTTRYWIDPASVVQFTDAIKKINAGIDKVKYPAKPSRWFQLANGGDGPQFVLHTDRTSMADMEPLDKSIDDAMGDAYGKSEGAAIMDSLRKSIKRVQTELRVYRPDLSYSPGK